MSEDAHLVAVRNTEDECLLRELLSEPRERYERRIARAKQKEYPRRPPENWTKADYASTGLLDRLRMLADTVDRVSARDVSEADFCERYERGSRPVVVRGLVAAWASVARRRWCLEQLLRDYGSQRFKVGEDDDGYAVYVKLRYFVRYMLETRDDSPLYVFDSSFAERDGTRSMRHDWTLPKFFTEDLFKLVGERRRPPYRWFVCGPARSGSYIHIDPLGTSAWNALLAGHKLWALLPPGTPKEVVQPPKHEGGREAIGWFAHVYPTLVGAAEPAHRPLTLIQRPGEVMFVPGGWWHVVLNLDVTVAVTQNFCSHGNFDAVWPKARKSRPKMSAKLREQLRAHSPRLFARTDELAAEAPASSDSSSSSSSSSYSSSSSSGSDSDSEGSRSGRRSRAAPCRGGNHSPSRSPRRRSNSPRRRSRSRERGRRDDSREHGCADRGDYDRDARHIRWHEHDRRDGRSRDDRRDRRDDRSRNDYSRDGRGHGRE